MITVKVFTVFFQHQLNISQYLGKHASMFQMKSMAFLSMHLFVYLSSSDFGYFRPENQSECVEQPELKGHDLEFCLYGKQELLKTSG